MRTLRLLAPSVAFAVLILAFSVHAQVVTGTPPFGSFDGGPDIVNLANVNVHLTIAVLNQPGRGIPLSYDIGYDSSIWYPVTSGSTTTWQPITRWGWQDQLDGATGELTYAQSQSYFFQGTTQCTKYTQSNWVYIDASGTPHAFSGTTTKVLNIPPGCTSSQTSFSAVAPDGSGYTLNAAGFGGTVISSSGLQIHSPIDYQGSGGYVEDTNGNYTSGGPNWKDSTGRTALELVTGTSSNQYEYQDTTGTYRTITLNLQSFNVKTNFNCSGIGEYSGTLNLPVSIVYPNGTQYSISYEATPNNSGFVTGRVSKFTLPTGGYIQYTYGSTNDGISCTDGSTVSLTRTVNDGTNTNAWTFSRAPSGSNWVTTETYPQMPYDSAANQTVYTFNSSAHEITRQIYQGSATSGTLLRAINSTWASNNTPATQTTVLEDSSTQSEIETTYDNYGNLDVMKEHDFGSGSPGSILRTTNYTYLSTSAYTNLNIVDRVTDKTIADSTGTVQYQEATAYDGNTLSPCPTGIPQHDDTNYPCTFTTRGNATSFTTYTNAATPSGPETKNSYYDFFGNLVQQDADCCHSIFRNFSTTTEYSSPDTIVRGPSGGTQITSSLTYNAYTGQIASITDPNNQATSYTYDSMRRLLSESRPDTSKIQYAYNDTAHTVTTTLPVDSSHSRSNVEYQDGLGRLTKNSVSDASQNVYAIVQHLFDPVGRPYQASDPYTSSAQYWATKQYDALSRQTKVMLQDNSQYIYSYATNTVTTTDPAGHQRKTQSDGLRRLSVFTEPDPTKQQFANLANHVFI